MSSRNPQVSSKNELIEHPDNERQVSQMFPGVFVYADRNSWKDAANWSRWKVFVHDEWKEEDKTMSSSRGLT